uniref:Uncharacterized protein n=1 Tax=uncultured marine virus TaxID=186617 RepID=A0A0F7L359_9VIRU|nr:hypothetical protein [uncultured marine virus]
MRQAAAHSWPYAPQRPSTTAALRHTGHNPTRVEDHTGSQSPGPQSPSRAAPVESAACGSRLWLPGPFLVLPYPEG